MGQKDKIYSVKYFRKPNIFAFSNYSYSVKKCSIIAELDTFENEKYLEPI